MALPAKRTWWKGTFVSDSLSSYVYGTLWLELPENWLFNPHEEEKQETEASVVIQYGGWYRWGHTSELSIGVRLQTVAPDPQQNQDQRGGNHITVASGVTSQLAPQSTGKTLLMILTVAQLGQQTIQYDVDSFSEQSIHGRYQTHFPHDRGMFELKPTDSSPRTSSSPSSWWSCLLV